MTNGEMIKRMFPNETDFETDFDENWWNAEYKGGFIEGLIKKIEVHRNRWASGITEQEKGGVAALDIVLNIIKEYCGE